MPAAFTVIDDLQIPVQVAGHRGLELCNTLAGWNGPPEHDYLLTYDHLAVWACAVGLIPAAGGLRLRAAAREHPGQALLALEEARRLRRRTYDVLLDRADVDAFSAFEESVRSAGGNLRLTRSAPVRREVSLEVGLLAPVHAAAWAASEVLVSPAHARVRHCPGTGCGWLFLDRSGRRRWCTMSTCGNRSKARRFAARHREV
jgi:predicted RNA-binding Zn ribbon-like protein